MHSNFWPYGKPAEVVDYRDSDHPFTTLRISDKDGCQISVFFNGREELIAWLSSALADAAALPEVVPV